MSQHPDDIFKKPTKIPTKKEEALYLLNEALSRALKHYAPKGEVTDETKSIREYIEDQKQKVTRKKGRKLDPKKITMGQDLLKKAKIGIKRLKL